MKMQRTLYEMMRLDGNVEEEDREEGKDRYLNDSKF